MSNLAIAAVIFCVFITGCDSETASYARKDIVKIADFRLSPDEEKIAFSAVSLVGNLDIWVIDIDGKNLKKLTFQDHSPVNQIAKFFRKHRWKNFFEIDMCYPEWTNEGRIEFCQKLTRYDMWGPNIISMRFWTINPDGTGKKPKTTEDRIFQRKPFDPINRAEISEYSNKHKKKIFIKDNNILILDSESAAPLKLI
jgi:hypothetical protein